MTLHSAMTPALGIHVAHAGTVADNAALLAQSVTAADHGKVYWQLDTNEWWRLIDYSGPTYVLISSASTVASSTDNAFPRFDGASGEMQNGQTTEDDSGNVTVAGNIVVGGTVDGRDIAADAATLTATTAKLNGLWLEACEFATTSNITLSGSQTVDGESTGDSRRVLVWRQTTRSQNGLYLTNSGGAWTRVADFDADADLVAGVQVRVTGGDSMRGSFHLADTGAATMGTDSQFWLKNESGILAVSGTTYTLKPEDINLTLRFTESGSAITVTVDRLPTMGIGDAGTGKAVALVNTGGQQITVTAGTSITLRYDSATYNAKTNTAAYSQPVIVQWWADSGSAGDVYLSGGLEAV